MLPIPIKFLDEDLPVPTKAPTVGEHTDAVLRTVLGWDETQIAALATRVPSGPKAADRRDPQVSAGPRSRKSPVGTPGPGGYPRRSLTGAAGGPSTPCGGRRPGPAPQNTRDSAPAKPRQPRNPRITPGGLPLPHWPHARDRFVTQSHRTRRPRRRAPTGPTRPAAWIPLPGAAPPSPTCANG